MINLSEVAEKLEAAGAIHAPEQGFLEEPGIDGRFVTLRDPPGIYYILGTDNADKRDRLTEEVQIIFLGKQNFWSIGKAPFLTAEQVGEMMTWVAPVALDIGYAFKKVEGLSSDAGTIPSLILAPF